MDDPTLLARLMQKNNILPDEDDILREGKKVLPVEALSSTYKKFLNADNSFVVQTTSYKGGKGKGKGGKLRTQEGKSKARWLPQEPTSFDLLMLPLPDLVNREDGTYLLEGSGNDGETLFYVFFPGLVMDFAVFEQGTSSPGHECELGDAPIQY